LSGTAYNEFQYGKGPGWNIELKYLNNGVYTGVAMYPKYRENEKNQKTDVIIRLRLSTDLSTGNGAYVYKEREDFGNYSFQISEMDSNKIIIQYKNVVPSGIAEGYEVWRKVNPRK
jgi:phage pi2 protein 07